MAVALRGGRGSQLRRRDARHRQRPGGGRPPGAAEDRNLRQAGLPDGEKLRGGRPSPGRPRIVTRSWATSRTGSAAWRSSSGAAEDRNGTGSRWASAGQRWRSSSGAAEDRNSHRNRRPPTDPVNALLSYTYGLLRGLVHGAAEQVGLDPYIGFLHGIRPAKPALALDLMEEFRPALADRFALTLLRSHLIWLPMAGNTAGRSFSIAVECHDERLLDTNSPRGRARGCGNPGPTARQRRRP
ncbi:CRISPR-associated endonuclease Cas1 [Streptomyces sp. NPDC058373]|uniref:CRISPR-associated endonuclease Cas1 n=1 Tax=Streptomyces sp. NPDC058373 TaxID=3346465 RepID=UPI0036627242